MAMVADAVRVHAAAEVAVLALLGDEVVEAGLDRLGVVDLLGVFVRLVGEAAGEEGQQAEAGGGDVVLPADLAGAGADEGLGVGRRVGVGEAAGSR